MVSALDFKRIAQLIINTSSKDKLITLQEKLLGAEIIQPEDVPGNLITMNTEVTYDDLTVQERNCLRLVYQASPLYGNQTSILGPLGTALLGMKINESASFKLRDGSLRTIRVVGIKFQPEANKQFDL